MKKPVTEQEIQAARKRMKEIAFAANREELLATIINDTYDPEFPIAEVIQAIFNTGSAEPFEDVYYFTPTLPTKEVYLLTSNCNVTHSVVSPATKNTLSWTDAVTPDYYICLKDLLQGDHNVLDLYAQDILEALNRYEIYAAMQLLSAGATARGNLFTLDSGVEKLTLPKLVAMKKAVRKYGKSLVLISGEDVTEDVDLLDYDADKNRPVDIMKVVDQWIPIESLDVSVGGVSKDVIDDDVAYLVAVSDSKKNKPGYMIRRKISGGLLNAADTQVVGKERAILVTGNVKAVDTVDKFAKGIAGVEEFGAVLSNSYTVAKFTRA